MAALLHAGFVAAALLLLGQSVPPPDPPVIELVLMPAPQPAPPAPLPAVVQTAPTSTPAPEPVPEPEPKPVQHKSPPLRPAPPRPAPHLSAPVPPAPSPMTEPPIAAPVAPAPAPAVNAPIAPTPAPAPASAPAAENYGAILHAWLLRFRDYPQAARLRRQEGIAQIALTLDASGRLLQARLYASSGFDLLDRAALAMAERAAPYPPAQFPPGVTRTTYIVPVRYALE